MSEPHANPTNPLVTRLLGPSGAELTCEQCFDELDRYVELELEARDADATIPGMAAHLEGCPACAEDHESLRELIRSERRAGFAR